MKKLVLIGAKDSGNKNDVNLIADKFSAEEFQVVKLNWEDLLFEIKKGAQKVTNINGGVDLKDAGLVIAMNWYKIGNKGIYRDVALSLALYLKHHNVEFWNSEMLQQRSTTKLSALMQLSLAGYDVPRTHFSLQAQNLIADAQDYPVIIKDLAGSRGQSNFLVNNFEELKHHLEAQPDFNRYLLEEYIPNDHDLRVICFGGEPQMAIKRSRASEKTHLNNTSQGGKAERLTLDTLPQTLLTECRDICKLMGREMAGIDIMPANDGSSRQVILEVNAIPQLTSGSFVDEKLSLLSGFVDNYLERQA